MTTPASNTGSRLSYLLPVLLLLAFGLSGIVGRDLWTPDEPRVAAISLEMSRTGDFVIPRLAGEPFVEEPPLYYAAAAMMLELAGSTIGNTGAIRLTSILWGLGSLVVCFLLARRFFPARQALRASLMLATMLGFIENSHWIRVDAALLFFVTAAMWCFAESLSGNRRWFAVPAGVFMAGAFLVKGVVGPGMIALGWLALFAARAWRLYGEEGGIAGGGIAPGKQIPAWRRAFSGIGPHIVPHIVCVLTFLGIAGAWILLFQARATPELWHEWFWINQVGRALGTAPQLGHLKQGHPFYYFKTIIIYALPWTPLIGLWAWRLVRDLYARRTIVPVNLFLLVWSIAVVAVLTIS
ncbi:MAG: glycosyltransferase family 39 protein, partial [bacterium]